MGPPRGCWMFVSLVTALTVLRDSPELAHGCCPAFGKGNRFSIADQRILIAWDPETKIEHFVREASFKSQTRGSKSESDSHSDKEDFGFLVPSPTQPQIEEADATVFSELDQKIQPRVDVKNRWLVNPSVLAWPFLLLGASSKISVTSRAVDQAPVRVLETKKVAGYEVAILKAEDPNELMHWLEKNDYQARDDLKEWVVPYLEKGWIISAFKYDSQSNRTQVGSVRISFLTDTPVFPYRVPKDQFIDPDRGNRLQVFVVGPGKASGTLGDGDAREPWNRPKLRFSMPVANEELKSLVGSAIPDEALRANQPLWLTAWDDSTWPSSDKDLWFSFDASGTPYQQVRTVTRDRWVHLPLDLMGIAFLGVLIARRRRRNRE
jgi:hypothetical protein